MGIRAVRNKQGMVAQVRIESYSDFLSRAKTEYEHAADDAHFRPTDHCFFCGEPLGDDLVMWQGCDDRAQQVWLHRDCAKELGGRLICDALIHKYRIC